MKPTKWIEEKNGCAYVHIHVQPKASRNEVAGVHDNALKVRLTSPPVEGAANALLVKFIAKRLGVARSNIAIVSGEKSRRKTLRVEGISKEAVLNLL